ncbi:MAG: PTS sugar transporter subunit IIA [Candidatus Cloacimonadota bacterium]|nr:PTS sugar transporter subunit IIA [Candidatus Cloacimonadota bacterium]
MEKIIEIYKYMSADRIIDIQSNTKDEALRELADVISTSDKVTKKESFIKKIFEREKLMSTGIGYGIAIPHIRDKSIQDFVIALGRKKSGLEYDSIDNKPVKLIFMIGASDKQDKDYIRVLSKLVLRLKNKNFVRQLLNARSADEIYGLIKKQE